MGVLNEGSVLAAETVEVRYGRGDEYLAEANSVVFQIPNAGSVSAVQAFCKRARWPFAEAALAEISVLAVFAVYLV